MRFFIARKEETDVVVIGSGAGGGVVAKELAEAGLSVVVLEAGRRYDPLEDYRTDQRDFELHDTWDPADPARDRYSTTAPFGYSRVKGVGGSTLAYLAVTPRFHESDFQIRTLDGVADDWPIRYADLEPYYTRVEYELGVSGLQDPVANPFDPPRSRRYPTPPHRLNCASKAIKRGADRLGWHMTPSPLAIPTVSWGGRSGCMRAGVCALGCRAKAKSSIDVTYIPKAEATGRVEIRSRAMAREITIGRDGRVRSVIYFDAERKEREIHARAIVVAGNAIETPRLLLMSQSGQFPRGLANSSGLVGKYFMEHLFVRAYGRFEERLDAWRGPMAGGAIQDFYESSPRHAFARGWMIEIATGQQWPIARARKIRGWGRAHKQAMQRHFGHMVGLASVGEQLPDIRNEVTLDLSEKDSYDLPIPRLTNRPRANDRAMLDAISQSLRDLFEASGASEIQEPEHAPGSSSHYMGTCRMGNDPSTSVVDSWGRAHDVPNLFIADGSVFVTGAAANPSLTISALATRTAEGIARGFHHGEL